MPFMEGKIYFYLKMLKPRETTYSDKAKQLFLASSANHYARERQTRPSRASACSK